MSLKHTMKLRVTLATTKAAVSYSSNDESEDKSKLGYTSLANARVEKSPNVETWQETLAERIKDAEEFFLYDRE